jgi:hypothetical protein
MPDEVREPFEEAQSVLNLSPWSACILLRVSLERLAKNLLGEQAGKYRTLDAKIQALNLSPDLQTVCDALRKIGNDAAHEQAIDFGSPQAKTYAETLSQLLNALVGSLITPRKAADQMLAALRRAQGAK